MALDLASMYDGLKSVADTELLLKPTITLVPLMLSHLLVHLPPLPLRSQIAFFSMPRLISGINFYFHFMNQSHLFMLTSIHPSLLHFPHPSPLHSFTLNSKLTFLVNLLPHRSLTIDTSDWLPQLMGRLCVIPCIRDTVFISLLGCTDSLTHSRMDRPKYSMPPAWYFNDDRETKIYYCADTTLSLLKLKSDCGKNESTKVFSAILV